MHTLLSNEDFTLTIEQDILVKKKKAKRSRRVKEAYVVTCLETGECIAWERLDDDDNSQKNLALSYFTQATQAVTNHRQGEMVKHPFWGEHNIGILKRI